jgi:hypothetical protein
MIGRDRPHPTHPAASKLLARRTLDGLFLHRTARPRT